MLCWSYIFDQLFNNSFMIYLIIFLIGFIWITRDIIRVSETFNDSYFKKYKGHLYIDPQVSWKNKGNMWTYLYFIVAPFSDLFHSLGTLILGLFFTLIFYRPEIELNFTVFFAICFLCYGSGVWLGYQLWRKILNK